MSAAFLAFLGAFPALVKMLSQVVPELISAIHSLKESIDKQVEASTNKKIEEIKAEVNSITAQIKVAKTDEERLKLVLALAHATSK